MPNLKLCNAFPEWHCRSQTNYFCLQYFIKICFRHRAGARCFKIRGCNILNSHVWKVKQNLETFCSFLPKKTGVHVHTWHPQHAGARLTQKKKLHPKFLQNPFFHTSIYVIQGKDFYSAIESATQNFFWSLQKWLVFHEFDHFKGT